MRWTSCETRERIIGKDGWCSSAVVDRIRSHPRFGTNLFWKASANDAFLDRAYRSCYCYVQASVGEGFGLPIVEAAGYALPIICSDIDVFKEIGGDGLTYFESGNSVSLAQRLSLALETPPAIATIETFSWSEAFLALRETLEECAAPQQDRGMAA